MENNNGIGVRKGAWTSEEDILLRNCIDKFGEGKWHLVPLRAGLNRCRKSCRLRWLNYLRPNIKRGCFGKDEADLIVRLHKLLGNRWSLIAGRLPGRTANDVKNFWNTHISKKSPSISTGESGNRKSITHSNIVRPRPRTFSILKQPAWSTQLARSNSSAPSIIHDDARRKLPSSSAPLPDHKNVDDENASLQEDLDNCIRWWENLLDMTENGQETPLLFSDDDPRITTESTFLEDINDRGSNM